MDSCIPFSLSIILENILQPMKDVLEKPGESQVETSQFRKLQYLKFEIPKALGFKTIWLFTRTVVLCILLKEACTKTQLTDAWDPQVIM